MSGLWNDISYGFRHLAETYSHGCGIIIMPLTQTKAEV